MTGAHAGFFVRHRPGVSGQSHIEKMTKLECAACIYAALKRTAYWRERVYKRFNDTRNLDAASLLRELARQAAALTEDQWSRLKPHFDRTSERFCDAMTEVGRIVGMRSEVTDFDSYVVKLTELLQVAR
jgi:hypothetical protein